MANAIVEAFAPATVANVGVGFDILGLALCEPGDIVIAERQSALGVRIAAITGDGGRLPLEAAENTAGVAALHVLKQIGIPEGVSLTVHKHLPLGSGLGSSAASAVAGALAVNALFDEPLTREQLLEAALEGEAVASGYHIDNVGPALFGGITLFDGVDVASMLRLPIPQNLYLALVTPAVEVKTSDARAVLPKEIPMKTMIQQTAGVARLIDALYRGDVAAMARAMESDRVVEPAREHLMPHFAHIRAVAKANGALGLVISGAGPTLLAVCDDPLVGARVAAAMQAAYESVGIGAVGRHGQVCVEGARVLSVR